jgi:hypothetical protein
VDPPTVFCEVDPTAVEDDCVGGCGIAAVVVTPLCVCWLLFLNLTILGDDFARLLEDAAFAPPFFFGNDGFVLVVDRLWVDGNATVSLLLLASDSSRTLTLISPSTKSSSHTSTRVTLVINSLEQAGD